MPSITVNGRAEFRNMKFIAGMQVTINGSAIFRDCTFGG